MLNINTLSRSKISKDYLNLIRSEDFNPLIFEATRKTEATKTYLNKNLVLSNELIKVELPP